MRTILFSLALALFGCKDDDSGGNTNIDAAGCAADGGGAFGAACTDACECATGVCHQFGQGDQACTQTCTADDQCPSGSQGKKCNNMGVCRI